RKKPFVLEFIKLINIFIPICLHPFIAKYILSLLLIGCSIIRNRLYLYKIIINDNFVFKEIFYFSFTIHLYFNNFAGEPAILLLVGKDFFTKLFAPIIHPSANQIPLAIM